MAKERCSLGISIFATEVAADFSILWGVDAFAVAVGSNAVAAFEAAVVFEVVVGFEIVLAFEVVSAIDAAVEFAVVLEFLATKASEEVAGLVEGILLLPLSPLVFFATAGAGSLVFFSGIAAVLLAADVVAG